MIKRISLVLIAVWLMSSSLVAYVPSVSVGAVSGACYFNTKAGPVVGTSGCAVGGNGDYGTNDIFAGRTAAGPNRIPKSVNTKSEFIKFITNKFNGSNDQNRIGAAFIMQEMRGSRAWPSNQDRNDWVTRMQDSSVTFNDPPGTQNVVRTSWYDPGPKNTFYDNYLGGPRSRDLIVIKQNGRIVAKIERECGNLVAGTIPLKNRNWSISPTTALITPRSGKGLANASYQFNHTVKNIGPNNVKDAGRGFIDVQVRKSPSGAAGSWVNVGANNRYRALAKGATRQIVSSGTLPAGFKAGDRYCEQIRVTYGSANGRANGPVRDSAYKCISADTSYNLIPQTSVNPGGAVDAGSSVGVVPTVDNNGLSESNNTQWQLISFSVAPNVGVPSGSTGAGIPCTYYVNGCATMSEGTGKFAIGAPSAFTKLTGSDFSTRNFSIPDTAPLGTKFCFALSVRPYNRTTTNWRYGAPVCVVVSTNPKVQIWGYDAKVGGDIDTSKSTRQGLTYGSWSEYGLLSNGKNTNMGSGSGLLGGNTSSGQVDWASLTFANLPTFGSYNGAFQTYVPGSTGAITIGNSIGAKAYGPGDKLVIKATGTLHITGDLRYQDGGYASINQLPRVVIIADDIVIDDNVTRIDPWLVSNRINTCSRVKDGPDDFPKPTDVTNLSATVCNKPLVFNGPVIAKSVYLYRTTTNDAKPDTPAEVFNLRADAFLSSYAGGGTVRPVASTDLITEVSPRF